MTKGAGTTSIHWFEPWFFLLFGLFHLHRVWALADRQGYAAFWLGVLENRGWFYFALMGLLAGLCLAGLRAFVRHRRENAWWRWIYVLGGGYVLWDLFAIAAGLDFWEKLLYSMFDTALPCWDLLWGGFVLLGAGAFALGLALLRHRRGFQRV